MATKLFSDSARHTTLASGISGGAASITVADATGWPSPSAGQEANVAVDFDTPALVEVGTYTSRSGNVLSGVTGISNAHSAGVKVRHVISAADAQKAVLENAAAGTASLRSLGTTATTAAAGNDARLSDVRTPAYSGCLAFAGSNQSIPNATDTTLTFATEEFDVGGYHSTASNTERLAIPVGKAGKYLVQAHIQWAANASGYRQISFQVFNSGGSLIQAYHFSQMNPVAGVDTDQDFTKLLTLAVGDYVTCVVTQTSGGALNALGARTAFGLTLLGA